MQASTCCTHTSESWNQFDLFVSPQKVMSHIQKPYYIFAHWILNYYWFQEFSLLSILQQAFYFLVISDLVALVQSLRAAIVFPLSDLPMVSGTAVICTFYERSLLNWNFLFNMKIGGVHCIGVGSEIKPSMRTFLNIQIQDVDQTWVFSSKISAVWICCK